MAAVVRMPEVATGTGEAAIQSWLVEVGATVRAGQPIVEIETEKAVVEYETEADGVLAAILLPAGEAAAVGVPIAVVAVAGEDREAALAAAAAEGIGVQRSGAASEIAQSEADPSDAPSPSTSTADASGPELPEIPHIPGAERIFASPLVRRLARERGVDLSAVRGSGPRGRIVRRDLDDVTSPVPGASSLPLPSPQHGTVDAVDREDGYVDVPHTGMRRAIARRLTEAKNEIPHIYLTAHCRVDALLALRAQINAGRADDARISVNDLVVKAVAAALGDVPEANAIWMPDAVRRFSSVDIAIAVSLPGGLVTPVVRGVESLSIGRLSETIRELAGRARNGRLKQSELEGGSFSVSNLGMHGTQEFSAIINPPQAGILAVGAASPRAVVGEDGGIASATVMTVTLSADHRVLDGALAAQWLAAFVTRIEHPLSILV